jgi:hypothetical protein
MHARCSAQHYWDVSPIQHETNTILPLATQLLLSSGWEEFVDQAEDTSLRHLHSRVRSRDSCVDDGYVPGDDEARTRDYALHQYLTPWTMIEAFKGIVIR